MEGAEEEAGDEVEVEADEGEDEVDMGMDLGRGAGVHEMEQEALLLGLARLETMGMLKLDLSRYGPWMHIGRNPW
jgi:hypothetical protein